MDWINYIRDYDWVWPGLSAEMTISRRDHTGKCSLGPLTPVSLSPQWATVSQETPTPASSSGPGSYRVTALLCIPVHLKACVHPLGMESPFLPVVWSSYTQDPLVFKAKCPGSFCSWCQTPRLWSLTWGSEFSSLWENFFDIFILICGSPT